MLTLLKRWLGWEADSEFYSHAPTRQRARPASATAHLFSKDGASRGQVGSGRRAVVQEKKKTTVKPKKKPAVVKPNPEFDPYNTGKFDRSASWERISKNQR
jgi:hypothetical protein